MSPVPVVRVSTPPPDPRFPVKDFEGPYCASETGRSNSSERSPAPVCALMDRLTWAGTDTVTSPVPDFMVASSRPGVPNIALMSPVPLTRSTGHAADVRGHMYGELHGDPRAPVVIVRAPVPLAAAVPVA